MEQLQENVKQVLAQIRPTLQRDGGDVEFAGLDPDMVVKVRLTGLPGLPDVAGYLKDGIERFRQRTGDQGGRSRGVNMTLLFIESLLG